ncbi:DUF3592 domain-containing protein [Streptomyces sp. NPDC020898]|uniref:DUF3592 domain-containing protein n=1 Tax=Streptomyces sp. NPDC020898 TaxID=3365101 RepID=UPI00379C5B9D
MAKKQRKRSPSSFQNPQSSARAAAAKEAARKVAEERNPRPLLPQLRLIFTLAGLGILCIVIFLALWLPSKAVVDDLRSRGVTATATVTKVDDKPEIVEVRFRGPSETVTANLHDYAGMRPEVQVGQPLAVRYDPQDSSRVLTESWVNSPPLVNLPMLGTAALALFLLAAAAFLTLRRRQVLSLAKVSPQDDSPSSSLAVEEDGKTAQLSKE